MAPLSEQQLATRKTGLGSSDIAAIMGEDPWKSALDVWLSKTGRKVDEGNLQTQMGIRTEEIIADQFAHAHALKLRRCGTVVHHELPWVLATPDRVIAGTKPRELLEAKNVGWRVLPRWRIGADGFKAPPYVQLQGMWQCLVTGAAAVWVVAWLGGRDWYEERFPYDPELGDAMLAVGERWWHDHVVADVQPDPDGSDGARKILEALHEKNNGKIQPATEEVTAIVSRYAKARAEAKAAREEMKVAANLLCARIGDLDGFEGEWGHATWVASGKGTTSWAKVAAELGASPTLIAKHTKEPGRKLRVVVTGEEEEDDNGNG